MRVDKLGIKQRAAMLALMAQAREVSNTELREITGFVLDGEFRRRLNALDLVASNREKRNQPFTHELTDQGWAWCAKELTEEVPAGAGSAGGALYAVLGGVARFLEDSGLRLHEVFKPVPVELELDKRVRFAYETLVPEPRAWVALADLREFLDGQPRAEVDQALRRLSRRPGVNIVPESNQKTLTTRDHDAAIRIGGEDCHLLSIGER